MCNPSQTIPNWVEPWGLSDAEEWLVQHREAMGCWRLQDEIDFGLLVLSVVRRHAERCTNELEEGKHSGNVEQCREDIAARYRWWLAGARKLLEAIRRFEQSGYEVERADKLREAYQEVAVMPLDALRIRGSIASLESGHGVPVKQALDELRNRLR